MTWRVYGASVRGTSHTRSGLPCQDAHDWRLFENGVACAVADGLGSAARADEGAQIAVAAALDVLATATDATTAESLMREAFAAARRALVQSSEEGNLRDFATTLLLAAASANWTAVGQIGDGAVVGRWSDGRLETLSLPQRGEYANETIPLTADDALEHLRVAVWPTSVAALMLFSDGLQALALDLASSQPFEPFFAPFEKALADPFDATTTGERLENFLASPRVCTRTDDDKTLLVAGMALPL